MTYELSRRTETRCGQPVGWISRAAAAAETRAVAVEAHVPAEWERVRGEIVKALRGYPEALKAVQEVLARAE